MSVIDPWPLNWKMPEKSNTTSRGYCPYSKRSPMLCAAAKHTNKQIKQKACTTCYMRQQSISDAGNIVLQRVHKLKAPVRHVCDRCGREIGVIDRIIYLEPEDRKGNALLHMELCYLCALQLLNWAGGEDFLLPDVDQETYDYYYGELVVKPKPKKRKKRHKKRSHRYHHTDNFDYFKNAVGRKYREEHPEDFDEDGNYIK